VAVKQINVFDTGRRHQLKKELEVLCKYNAPQLVSLLGVFFEEGFVFMVLEYMNRGSLQDFVEASGPLPEDSIRIIALQVLSLCQCVLAHHPPQATLGLQLLHSSSLVHRDIKPHNILLNSKGALHSAPSSPHYPMCAPRQARPRYRTSAC
jgi:serine/threonine protein kinase